MTAEVESLVRGAVRLDPTVRVEDLELAIRVLHGDRPDALALPKTYTRREVAKIFHVTPRTVSNWHRRHRLDAADDARGQTRCFTYESVMELYHGRR